MITFICVCKNIFIYVKMYICTYLYLSISAWHTSSDSFPKAKKGANGKKKIAVNPTPSLQQSLAIFLPQPPFRFWNSQGAIYKIKCADCQATYTDETCRNMNARLTEHERTTIRTVTDQTTLPNTTDKPNTTLTGT